LPASFHIDDRQVIRACALDGLHWLQHGFGTRQSDHWPPDGRVIAARQVHSDRVLIANGDSAGLIGEGDALITSQPGTLVAIRTADCLPILIADPGQRVVAAIHAGWRGTIANISSDAIEILASQFGSHRADLIVVIGPGIGECCFEVGPEVASQFGTIFPERNDLEGRANIHLASANLRQLAKAGVPAQQITVVEECTCCGSERYHSFRRDREASGRMLSAIGIVA
jgi:YfiH family protein